jgi:hypothetical protein
MTNYTKNFVQTTVHKFWVMYYLCRFVLLLIWRGIKHDLTKYSKHEAPYFANQVENLKNLEYGTEEYRQSLEKIRPALNHHYRHNSHHPQYHKNGFADMSVLDRIEMMADWLASRKRNKPTSLNKSFALNIDRFKIENHDAKWLSMILKEML